LVNEIPVNITLTSKAKETLKDIEALSSKTQTVKVNVQFTGGLDLKSIEEKLNQKPIKLDNFTVTDRTVNALRNILQTGLNAKPIKLDNFSVSDAVAKRLSGLVEEGVNIKPIKLNNFSLPQSALNSITNQIKIALESKQFNITVNAHTNTGAGGAGVPSGGSSKSTFSTSDIEGRQLGKLNQLRNANGTFTGVYYENDPYNISSGGKGGIKGTRSPVYQGVDIDGSVSPASQIAKRNQTLAELAPDIDNYELRALEGKQRRARELAARFALEEQNRRQSKINQDNQIDYYENLQTGGTNARRSQSNRQLADLFALQAQQAQQNKINQDNQIGYYEDVHASGVAARRSQSNRQLADLFAQQEQRRQEQASGIASFNDARLADRRGYVQGQQSRSQSELEEFVQKFGYVDASNPEYLRLAGLRNQKTTQGIGAANYLDLNLAKQVEASQKNIKEAGESYNSSFFGPKASEVAEQFGVDESVLPSSRRFLDSRRLNGKVGREIGLGAILSLANGQGAIGTGFQVAGSLAGGAVAGTAGASIGGAIGIAAYQSLEKVVDALKEVAAAGFTFERSILGIAAAYQQTSTVVDNNGAPLPIAQQVAFQEKRAKELQLNARSAFAQVGIGGEAEASILQATVGALGARGLGNTISDATKIKLAQGTAAAINITAPELASNPAVTRKDVFDIFAGLGQAGRTALGSRNPRLVSALSNVNSEEDAQRVIEQYLKPYIETFENSDSAVTQASRFNAQNSAIYTALGQGFTEKLTPTVKAFASLNSDKGLQEAATKLGNGLGYLVNPFEFASDYGKDVNSLFYKSVEDSKSPPKDSQVQENFDLTLGNAFQSADFSANDLGFDSDTDLSALNLASLAKGTSIQKFSALEGQRGKIAKILANIPANSISGNTLRESLPKLIAFNNADFITNRKFAEEGNTLSGNSIFGQIEGSKNSIDTFSEGEKSLQSNVDLAKRNLNSSQSNDQLVQAAGALQKAELSLAEARNKNFTQIQGLISSEEQLGQLRSAAISTVTFAGQSKQLRQNINNARSAADTAFSQASNTNDPLQRRQLELQGQGFSAQEDQLNAQEELQGINQGQQQSSLLLSVQSTTHSLDIFDTKIKGLNFQLEETKNSLKDLSKEQDLSRLEGQDKSVALLKDYLDKGGVLTSDITAKFDKSIFPEATSGLTSEALFGPGIDKEERDKEQARRRLSLFLDQNEAGRVKNKEGLQTNQLQQQQSDLEFQINTAPLQKSSLYLQQAGDLVKLRQSLGDAAPDNIKTAAAEAQARAAALFDEKGNLRTDVQFGKNGELFDKKGEAIKLPTIDKDQKSDFDKLGASLKTLNESLSRLNVSIDLLNTTMTDLPQQIRAVFKS
jgi:hypothetical protein